MTKFIHIFAGLVILSAVILIGTLTFWNVYNYKTLQINKEPLRILNENKVIKKGGAIAYELDYCKVTKGQVQISRKFVDGVIWALPESFALNPIGCFKGTYSVEVPHSLPVGEYRLDIDYTYKVNPIRDITVKTRTEQFSIIE